MIFYTNLFCAILIIDIFQMITFPFENILTWDNRFFKGEIVKAKILYLDEITTGKWPIEFVVLAYVINGNEKEIVVHRSYNDYVGKEMLIATNGEKAYRITRDKKECLEFWKRCLIVFFVFGYIIYKTKQFVNVKWVVFCVVFEFVITCITPFTGGTVQKHFRPHTYKSK